MTTHPRAAANRARGFSLIEVLIAMLVLAIGLLGLAALQAQGLKFNTDAYVRSQATVLAHDIMDRIRLNRDTSDEYVEGQLDDVFAGVANDTIDCEESGFAAADLAENDINCWVEDIAAVLPSPTASICRNGTAGCPCPAGINGCPAASSAEPYVDITIAWLDREFDTAAECLAVPLHQWYTAEQVCRVVQIWTIYP